MCMHTWSLRLASYVGLPKLLTCSPLLTTGEKSYVNGAVMSHSLSNSWSGQKSSQNPPKYTHNTGKEQGFTLKHLTQQCECSMGSSSRTNTYRELPWHRAPRWAPHLLWAEGYSRKFQNSSWLPKGHHLPVHATKGYPDKPWSLKQVVVVPCRTETRRTSRDCSALRHCLTLGRTCPHWGWQQSVLWEREKPVHTHLGTAFFLSTVHTFLPSWPLIKHFTPPLDYRRSFFEMLVHLGLELSANSCFSPFCREQLY